MNEKAAKRNILEETVEIEVTDQVVEKVVEIVRRAEEELGRDAGSMAQAIINRVNQLKKPRHRSYYDEVLISLCELKDDELIIYVKDSASILKGVGAFTFEVEYYPDDSIREIYVISSLSDDIESREVYDNFEEILCDPDIAFAVDVNFAMQGKFVYWHEFKDIVDGRSDKVMGEI